MDSLVPHITSSQLEKLKDFRLADELATKLGMSLENVREIYKQELDRLQVGARVVDYLPLFAARNAREILQQAQE